MQTNYSSIVIDMGSGLMKVGFGGEDGPRNIFNSIVGIPKMAGLKVGMEQKERYVAEEAISNAEFMNFYNPIQRGEVVDWDKFETLMHYLLYSQIEVVPEDISVLITETPLSSKKNRAKISELLFEKFNVQRCHIANSSMLGLFSYGKSSGIVVDSGYNITSTVPVYEGFPLVYASQKINLGGEDISNKLFDVVKDKVDKTYKTIKGKLLAEDIKDKLCFISMNINQEEKVDKKYILPDAKELPMGNELYQVNEILFNPGDNPELKSVTNMVVDSLNLCDDDVKKDINESICLIGGTSLMKNFPERLKLELSEVKDFGMYNMTPNPERQFSAWIGGSIMISLDNFQYLWVTKEEFDENGKSLVAIDSKCF